MFSGMLQYHRIPTDARITTPSNYCMDTTVRTMIQCTKVSHNTVGIFLPQELFCYDGQGTIPYLLYYTIVPYHAYVQSDTVSRHIVAPSSPLPLPET